ncbi:MAG: sugar transferase, partial [Eubacteriaceae bacterium]
MFLKRIFDLFFSIVLLIVLIPLFIVVGVAIKMDTPGPVFFKQKRIGKDNKPFMVYKFRSMSVGT